MSTKLKFDPGTHSVSTDWNLAAKPELLMHRIHAYPAKFPAFIVEKALEYSKAKKISVRRIADIFCGCGTTALEARRKNLEFWGCDINPVAVLIANVKRGRYAPDKLAAFTEQIKTTVAALKENPASYLHNNERIRYWFEQEQIDALEKLLRAIRQQTPTGIYQDFFLCAFSNILKSTSRWLTKSIKPQIDPKKKTSNVGRAFEKQIRFMIRAAAELQDKIKHSPACEITTGDFLKTQLPDKKVDMLITSPPYVTSYEYADLHQLSSLCLGYTTDYKSLRNGSIGSLFYENYGQSPWNRLSATAQSTFYQLFAHDKRKAKGVAQYFWDLNRSVSKGIQLLRSGGLGVYVIGNTEYHKIHVDNASFLIESMQTAGYKNIEVHKRNLSSSRSLTPYRTQNGRFSNDRNSNQVYAHEFVIFGRRP